MRCSIRQVTELSYQAEGPGGGGEVSFHLSIDRGFIKGILPELSHRAIAEPGCHWMPPSYKGWN